MNFDQCLMMYGHCIKKDSMLALIDLDWLVETATNGVFSTISTI